MNADNIEKGRNGGQDGVCRNTDGIFSLMPTWKKRYKKRERPKDTHTMVNNYKKKIPPKNEKKNKTSKGKLHFSSILEPSFFVVQIIFAF